MKQASTMNPPARFTVVVPTLNSASTLKRCLDSIEALNCRGVEFELILVDGGSTDGTIEIAKIAKAKTLVEIGASRGAACNIGARMAAGEVIAFTDADAAVASDWLSSIASEIVAEPDVDAVGGPDLPMQSTTQISRTVSAFDLFRRRVEANDWKAVFKIKGVNSAYKLNSFLKLGGFDPTLLYGEESELHARMVEKGMKIKFSPRIIVYHRSHQQTLFSMTRVFRNARLLAPLLFRKWMIKAALRDPVSPLTTLFSLFLAICLGVPILIVAWLAGYLLQTLVGGVILTFGVSLVYASVLISRTEGAGKLRLFAMTLLILPAQSILRGLGATLGALELLLKKTFGARVRR